MKLPWCVCVCVPLPHEYHTNNRFATALNTMTSAIYGMKGFINATKQCNNRHESETCILLRTLTNARRKPVIHTKIIRHKRHAYVHLHIRVRTYVCTPTCLPYYLIRYTIINPQCRRYNDKQQKIV